MRRPWVANETESLMEGNAATRLEWPGSGVEGTRPAPGSVWLGMPVARVYRSVIEGWGSG